MRLVNALCIALSTYSRIPVPQVEWNEENRRYAMCFFPVIGVLIGTVLAVWMWCCDCFGFGGLLRGGVSAAIPLLITGGIHMDGFMDTTDAMASWKSPEERMAILKDSHVGAFAVMACGLYMLFASGVLSEARRGDAAALAACFVLSRACSALAMTWLKSARKTGMLADFAQKQQKRIVTIASVAWVIAAAIVLLVCSGWSGLCAVIGSAVCLLCYRHKAYKYFGGVSGDLAGWFLQVTELTCLACVVLGRCVLG